MYEVKDKLVEELEHTPQMGYNIHGFIIEGATFEKDQNQIADTKESSEGVEFPVINIQCNEKTDDKRRAGNKKQTSLM